MTTIHVAASREYDIEIGRGLLDQAGAHIARVTGAGRTAAVISDTNVLPLYGQRLCSSLEQAGFRVISWAFPAGEASKNLTTYGQLLHFLGKNHMTRSDIIVALGGGVTGDMAGFAAATYQRGIPFIQVPTTLLAAVDSSVGGKTAIDLDTGKNQAGCFYQPWLVLCDPDTLTTLPEREYRCGCGEIIKYSVLFDADFFDELWSTPVKDQMERLRAAYATYEDAKDGDAVAEGDFVQIDYEGTVDGKKILEINPEAKIVGEGKGFWTQVEEGRFLPEILDAVKGMKIGETKEGVKAKFDKDAAPDGLKGAKAVYTVTLKGFRRRVLPDDKAFAEKAKAESVEKLAATIRESMEKRAVEQESARRENEAIDLLMKKVDFEVPGSQVRRAMDGYLQELAQRAQYSGLDASYFEKNRDQILKDAEATATKQVRLWYVIDAIAKEEKIEAKDEEKGKKVIEFILANAKK